VKVSKATRAAAIEALLDVASEHQQWTGFGRSPALIADFIHGPEWSLALSAVRFLRMTDDWAPADSGIYGGAASLLHAGWSD
jgi:hypothetical protein